jgi:hypothetical protein
MLAGLFAFWIMLYGAYSIGFIPGVVALIIACLPLYFVEEMFGHE